MCDAHTFAQASSIGYPWLARSTSHWLVGINYTPSTYRAQTSSEHVVFVKRVCVCLHVDALLITVGFREMDHTLMMVI